jgi:endothelin-converting enzyme/putative endopeptidase
VASPAPVEAAAPAPVDLGFDPTALDPRTSPCQDFYQYACGAWLARTPIPPDRPAWTRSFSVIHERNQDILHGILDAYAAGRLNLDEPDAHRVGDFYASCMDEPTVDKAGQKALADWLARIAAVSNLDQLATLTRWMQARGFNAFFSFSPDQDFRDATQMIGEADQGGLGLPDREYYLKQDPESQKLRAAYRDHIARMLVLAGETARTAAADADVVLDLETQLAKASMPLVDRRDPNKVYHRIDRAGLEAAAPHFQWRRYFVEDLAEVRAINVAVPDFFRGLDRLLRSTPLAKLRTYLRWHAVSDHAMALGPSFVDESFAFTSQNLTGAKVLLPRWKRCADATASALGEALAQPFVKKVFPADSKTRALAMVHTIESAFASDLEDVTWMDATTRAAALDKLHAMFNKIGYPDKWRRYDRVSMDRKSYIDNLLAATVFETERQYAKIGKPVDRQEWAMAPTTVNAYYNPQLNEMVFPASILQTPFFALGAPDAANYGAIGMVIGHELTHGFDDQGRKFDKDGNLHAWWTPEVERAYEEKTACLVKQYSSYRAYDDVTINGKLTLGENIADLGGVKLALHAFLHRPNAAPSKAVGDFTEQQRFFLALAQSWCTNRRPELDRSLAAVDPHSPPHFRVNGMLSDLPAFAAAFSCPAGSPMAPPEHCSVW